MRLYFTLVAEADLDDILVYIAQNRPRTARDVVKRIRSACELIASRPEIGEPCPEFRGEMRRFVVERWIVFYQTVGDSVRICRVLDGARDIESLF